MQTFLSESTFKKCAEALDNKRLNKQLLEARQIIAIVTDPAPTAGWKNHPAVLQWYGYEAALFKYAERIKNECRSRGIKYDTNWKVIEGVYYNFYNNEDYRLLRPWWWTDEFRERINITHRARLYEKDPTYYRRYRKFTVRASLLICCPKCTYFWPTHYLRLNKK